MRGDGAMPIWGSQDGMGWWMVDGGWSMVDGRWDGGSWWMMAKDEMVEVQEQVLQA